MIVLGLDPSLTGFGWCLHNPDVSGQGRVISKGVWKTTSSLVFVERYISMRESIVSLLSEHTDVECVGVESPPFGELWSEGLYGLFLYVNEALYRMKKDVVFFDPLSVKLLAKMDPKIRKGTMAKKDMIDAAIADLALPDGSPPKKMKWNHNEADAYIIARSAARFWQFHEGLLEVAELTPSEQHVFARTHKTKSGKLIKKGAIFREDDRFFRFSKVKEPTDD